MSSTHTPRRSPTLPLSLLAALCLLSACDHDNFIDPSNIGRWENTPVVLPILARLDVIDEPVEEISGLGAITREDLIPELSEYVVGPGDLITVTAFELITPGVDSAFTRRVNELGSITLPIVGEMAVGGQTPTQIEKKLVDTLDPDILRDPIVTVVVQEGRQRTFSIFGTPTAGPYSIVKNNFRLLDAIALGGGLPPNTEHVYVIRQVALSREVFEGRAPRVEEAPSDATEPTEQDPAKLLEELSEEPAPSEQPAPPPPANLEKAVEEAPADPQGGRYINVDGKWVLVKDKARTPGVTPAEGSDPSTVPPSDENFNELVTQRVMEIDANALMRGEAKYNVVIRPNDIVRVPSQDIGFVFISGAISRPGSYTLTGQRSLTLTQLVASAGDLDAVGIPERVDLYRRIGIDQQAIVRLNLRAIEEGVQPDIFLKPHDRIKVGTNLFATFAAVIRNSFRMSYGFGFLLDRNFGNDVFGPPPDSNFLR